MGTLRKIRRKMRKWFDRKGQALLDEAKELIKESFVDMDIDINDLFDDEKRKEIVAELKARVLELKGDLTEWVVDWAMEILWDEVRNDFLDGRNR